MICILQYIGCFRDIVGVIKRYIYCLYMYIYFGSLKRVSNDKQPQQTLALTKEDINESIVELHPSSCDFLTGKGIQVKHADAEFLSDCAIS